MTQRYQLLDTTTGQLIERRPYKRTKRHSTKRHRIDNHLLFIGIVVIIGLVGRFT